MRTFQVTQVDGIVRDLSNGADLERLMETHKLGPNRMVQLMDTRRGKSVRKARRRLGKIQRELLATRFSGFAMNRVIAVLQGEKPELWLRAATQLLEAADGKRSSAKDHPRSKEEQRMFEIDQAEMGRLMHLWALGREYQKRLAREQKEKGSK